MYICVLINDCFKLSIIKINDERMHITFGNIFRIALMQVFFSVFMDVVRDKSALIYDEEMERAWITLILRLMAIVKEMHNDEAGRTSSVPDRISDNLINID